MKIITNCILISIVFFLFSQCTNNKNENSMYLDNDKPGLLPELFMPGLISTGLNEGTCTFSPDGKELFFHIVYEKGHDVKVSLATSHAVNGKWTKPEFLNFSGKGYFDGYPFLSYDGEVLYFTSNRESNDPYYTSKNNIWYSTRNETGWTNPKMLKLPTNGKDDVSGISKSNTGKYYYTLITEKEQAIYCIEMKDGEFTTPIKLPENVNVGKYQFDGMIAPDDSYMILCACGLEDSFGSTDMYISFKNNKGQWSELINLGEEFNTTEVDGPATITPDGQSIFFSGFIKSGNWKKEKLNYQDVLDYQLKPEHGSSDVYWVDAGIIEKYRPEGF